MKTRTFRCVCFITWFRNRIKYGEGFTGTHPPCLTLLRDISGFNA
jgi:hypothetical protein